jgi:hypothetical protein
MALTKGVNSYVDLVEANAYFVDRLDVAAWESASDADKSKALVTATSLLDSLVWTGVAVSEIQPLAFPREGSFFDPRLGFEVSFDTAGTPPRIVSATFELAYHLLNNDGLLDETGTVDSLSIGSISLTNVRGASWISPTVDRLIKPMRVNVSKNVWWRAN